MILFDLCHARPSLRMPLPIMGEGDHTSVSDRFISAYETFRLHLTCTAANRCQRTKYP